MNGWGQLALLQEFTKTTGALHEAQILQLKYWPLVFFSHVVSHEFSWSVDEYLVMYKFKLNPKKKTPKEFRRRCTILDKAVKGMLGDEWSISIRTKGKEIFRSIGVRANPDL